MATINITVQADKDFVSNHRATAERLKQRAEVVASQLFLLSAAQADLAAVANRARNGLVNHKGALNTLLEDPITDMEIEYDESDVPVKLHTNADAVAFRALPPE